MAQPAPVRIVVRTLADLTLSAAGPFVDALGGDLMDAFVFNTIVSANIRHVAYTSPPALSVLPGEAGGDEERRAVSAHAVAKSLGLAYETVRGRIKALIERGLAERRSNGIVVPGEVLAQPALLAAHDNVHTVFQRTVRTLQGIEFDFAGMANMAGVERSPTPMAPPPPRLVGRVVQDFHLRCLESFVPTYGDVTAGTIWAGVMHANVRWIAASRELSWRYAGQDAPPPDDMREPISIRALAGELRLPYETVRRHARALIAQGFLKEIEGRGLITPTAALGSDKLGRYNISFLQHFVRMIGDLTRLGFDFVA